MALTEVERLHEEHEDLARKMEGITELMEGSLFPLFDSVEQGLLMCQIRAMRQYLEILEDRIAILEPSS